ncbi:RNA methylase family, partial [human gut metagenome]
NAQILDPFCGVGTMLIERDIRVPAREKYGIDIFGEAIRGARENASYAGEKINFINRDYFDFTHAYLFDEIITNMPVRGRKSKEETDAFYSRFFEKSAGLLKADGILVLYSNEQGFIRKQLRIRSDYRLLAEQCIREKDQFYLFVIQYKG